MQKQKAESKGERVLSRGWHPEPASWADHQPSAGKEGLHTSPEPPPTPAQAALRSTAFSSQGQSQAAAAAKLHVSAGTQAARTRVRAPPHAERACPDPAPRCARSFIFRRNNSAETVCRCPRASPSSLRADSPLQQTGEQKRHCKPRLQAPGCPEDTGLSYQALCVLHRAHGARSRDPQPLSAAAVVGHCLQQQGVSKPRSLRLACPCLLPGDRQVHAGSDSALLRDSAALGFHVTSQPTPDLWGRSQGSCAPTLGGLDPFYTHPTPQGLSALLFRVQGFLYSLRGIIT